MAALARTVDARERYTLLLSIYTLGIQRKLGSQPSDPLTLTCAEVYRAQCAVDVSAIQVLQVVSIESEEHHVIHQQRLYQFIEAIQIAQVTRII